MNYWMDWTAEEGKRVFLCLECVCATVWVYVLVFARVHVIPDEFQVLISDGEA